MTPDQIQSMVKDACALETAAREQAVAVIWLYAGDCACHIKALASEVETTRKRAKGLLPDVELAQLANGGAEHRQDWCKCDASVGMVPCEYCAIFDALRRTRKYLEDVIKG